MNINELLKGIVIGIAKIIPGFSGAVLMISFNLYDRAIYAITNFFENPKKHFFFLMNLGIGIVIGIVFFSKVISFLIANYYLYTMMLFLGLILGGIPVLKRKSSGKYFNYILILVSFVLMSILGLLNTNHTYVPKNSYVDTLVYCLAGFLEAVGTVLPGISSTALLMLLGVYSQYIEILGNALDVSSLLETISFVGPFFFGMVMGIVLITLLVNYLLKYYSEETFSVILGISLSSVFILLVSLIPEFVNVVSVGISFLLLGIGYLLTNKLS